MADNRAEKKVDILEPIAAEVVSTILCGAQPSASPAAAMTTSETPNEIPSAPNAQASTEPVQQDKPQANTMTDAEAAPDRRRGSTRHAVRANGTIVYSVKHDPLQCIVQDMSDTGARLLVERANTVPGVFRLRIQDVNLDVGCVVVWRTESEVGVVFQAAQW